MHVFVLTQHCDAGEHPVQLVTDGSWYYTWSDGHSMWPSARLARDGNEVEGTCPGPDCPGHVTWDLSEKGYWEDVSDATAGDLSQQFDWADMPVLTTATPDQLEAWLDD